MEGSASQDQDTEYIENLEKEAATNKKEKTEDFDFKNLELMVLLLEQFLSNGSFQEDRFVQHIYQIASQVKTESSNKEADTLYNQINNFISRKMLERKNSQENKGLVVLSLPQAQRLYMDGCFDLTHSGHFNAIRQAQLLCDVLVMGVVSSEAITLRKGPPIMTSEERKCIAEACKWVDQVHIVDLYDPTVQLVDSLNCTHVAHGDDLILGPDGRDSYYEFHQLDRMRVFKRTEGISTTDIVGKLLSMTKDMNSNSEFKKLRQQSGDGEGIKAKELEKQVQKQDDAKKKIKLLNTAKRIRQFSQGNRDPLPTDKIVYVDGSFDILHPGHIEFLKKARLVGDFVLVGVYEDETVNERKGMNYPILSVQERALNLLALKYVDEVIIGVPWKVSEKMIKQFNINVVCAGSITDVDYLKLEEDPYEIPKKLGIFKELQSTYTGTTHEFITRIVENRIKYLEVYEKKTKKQEDYQSTKDSKVQEI